MRSIGVVSVARSDYGIYLPLLRRIKNDPDLNLLLIVTGMHLSPEFGMTANRIEDDGFKIHRKIEMLVSSDTAIGTGKSIGLGTIGFAELYGEEQIDLLVVLGDRFEMLTAVVASLPFDIPIAHIHGGESTEGLIDEAIRHSISKMSHLHFVSNDRYGQRVVQMGEAPWRVIVSGSPTIDNLTTTKLRAKPEIYDRLGIDISSPYLLVTFHPITLKPEDTASDLASLLEALEVVDLNVVFTYPNADPLGRFVISAIQDFAKRHERAVCFDNLGTENYFSLMANSAALVGNSSSGIIEAASFEIPVVNVGIRQMGRIHGRNVINTLGAKDDIASAINHATSDEFRKSLKGMVNPYGNGNASEVIVDRIKSVDLGSDLLIKRFYEINNLSDIA